MKKRYLGIVMIMVLAVMLLPTAASALTAGSPGLSDNTYGAGSRSQAKTYEFAFGAEPYLEGNWTWPVYSAPSMNAYRAANGKASVHMEDDIYSAGWSGAWLLVRYPKVNGGYRVGWVPKAEINRPIKRTAECKFAYWTVTLSQNCNLTDDPLYESETLAYASKGEKLTYLGYYHYGNGREYAYVQGDLNGQPVCGFIPFNAIDW